MPRSPLAARLSEIRSPAGRLREKADLISRQRVAKSASPSGSVHTVWRRSSSTTTASIVNGCRPAGLAKCAAQRVDMLRQQSQPALRQIDGEEKAAPGNEVATVEALHPSYRPHRCCINAGDLPD